MSTVQALQQRLLTGSRRIAATGFSGPGRARVLVELLEHSEAPIFCVTPEEELAEELGSDLRFFLGDSAVIVVPAEESLPWDTLTSTQAEVERMGALYELYRMREPRIVVASLRSLAQRVVPTSLFERHARTLAVGDEVGRDALAEALLAMGYRSAPLVEEHGAMSVRGDLLDLYPPLSTNPVRLEFFGDTIERIRLFDPENQRTLAALPSVTVIPSRELFIASTTKRPALEAIREAAERQHVPSTRVRELLDQVESELGTAGLRGLFPGFFPEGLATVFDYLAHTTPLLYLDDPEGQERTLAFLDEEVAASARRAEERLELTAPPSAHFLSAAELRERLAGFPCVEGFGEADTAEDPVKFSFETTTALSDALREAKGLGPLAHWAKLQRGVACGSRGVRDRIRSLLQGGGLPTVDLDGYEASWPKGTIALYPKALSQGFVDRDAGLLLLVASDLLGPRASRSPPRRLSARLRAAALAEFRVGDLCVHADFGICRYDGLTALDVKGVRSEFLLLQFAEADRVYLPVDRLKLISKFQGGSVATPPLDKLRSGAFTKRKARVREQLLMLAAEQLELHAARKALPGFAFAPPASTPDMDYTRFEEGFEYELTVDQARAIEDVFADMQRTQAMDRLICGDVGFGKTEVAMRAAFLAVQNGKQVAVLVPTTLLAHQHAATFKKRFADFPVLVEVVSGLRSARENSKAFTAAREGRVDILIGTHKLLGAETIFKDLGLVILDEEHKLGVAQKERLKRQNATVDVLTLSATPLPRTLHMAMSGLWDMSLIATPPAERKAIRTFVNKFDPVHITEAIRRELARGGQVYFVHNRVRSLHSMERLLRRIVPGVQLGVAHGQMHEGQLARVMVDFVERRTQVLLATSIIESGLDIPNANTLIVNRADRFGLAQLYQLRGRIGRSSERAYAYLIAPVARSLTRNAARRLEALQSFTELGAGFQVASHDLELRGAGSILGGEQSGHTEAVGIALYADLVEEAIATVAGRPSSTVPDPEVQTPFPMLIPEHYVPDAQLRLQLYRRASLANTEDDLADFREELIDRFGELPAEVDILLTTQSLKPGLRRIRAVRLDIATGRLGLTFASPPDGPKLVQCLMGYRLEFPSPLRCVVRLDNPGTQLLAVARSVIDALSFGLG